MPARTCRPCAKAFGSSASSWTPIPIPSSASPSRWVARGELRARLASGESVGLAAGDVLVVGPREGGALATRRGRAEILLFRAQGEWLARALALAGFEPEPAQPRAATLRAGTEPGAARRAVPARARQLREPRRSRSRAGARLPGARAAGDRPLGAARTARAGGAPAERARRRARRRAGKARRGAARAAESLAVRGGARILRAAGLAARARAARLQLRRSRRRRCGIARAQLLLAESDLPVIEVAAEAGFGSLGHFNQRFRASTGRTPSAFRAAIRAPLARRPGIPIQARGPAAGRRRRARLPRSAPRRAAPPSRG